MSGTMRVYAENPKFQLIRNEEDSHYYFQMRAVNGKVIITSRTYGLKADCLEAIGELRQQVHYELSYREKQYSFCVKSGLGNIIALSRNYTSSKACENGIEVLHRDIPLAAIEDLT